MEPLISSIMGWGPTWAPRSWANCGGQLIAISQNEALFSLIGTIYGGDGRTTFALPDLRSRIPIGAGQSPGTSFYPQGAMLGSEDQVLTQLNLPVHNHGASTQSLSVLIEASSDPATSDAPSATAVFGASRTNIATPPSTDYRSTNTYVDATQANEVLSASFGGNVTIGNAGGNQPFDVGQPIETINFIIALFGLYPSRN
jgi:microcystin-dependent protein